MLVDVYYCKNYVYYIVRIDSEQKSKQCEQLQLFENVSQETIKIGTLFTNWSLFVCLISPD